MFQDVSLMTLDSILKCAFTYDNKNVQTQGCDNPYIKAVYEMSELAVQRVLFLPYHSDVIYHMTYSGYRFRRACGIAHRFSKQVIESRRNVLRNNAQEKEKKYLDFLDILLGAKDTDGNGLTDEEIQNEVDTFMFEGQNTTASGISWCLYNLARHPEYQQQCRDEVNRVMADKHTLTWNDLSEMKMLTMCIKESLRLHPPVPSVFRKNTKPLTLPDNRTVTTGSWINIGIFGVHHNQEVWEDPERYDPFRFTPENSSKRSPLAFIPFSAGPRNCIGQNFAMNEMKTCIALLLKHFTFTVDESKEVTCIPEVVLRTAAGKGLWLNVSPVIKV